MTPKGRNDVRRFRVDLLVWLAKAVLTAGLVKPVFAPGSDDLWLGLGAALIGLAAVARADYMMREMENEE